MIDPRIGGSGVSLTMCKSVKNKLKCNFDDNLGKHAQKEIMIM